MTYQPKLAKFHLGPYGSHKGPWIVPSVTPECAHPTLLRMAGPLESIPTCTACGAKAACCLPSALIDLGGIVRTTLLTFVEGAFK